MKSFAVSLSLAFLAAPCAVAAQHAAAPETGEQTIAGLSADDIATIRAGGGWGLAKPAEMNGAPGPKHLLELADRLELDDAQIAGIEDIRERMTARAVAAGERFLTAEAALTEAFAAGSVQASELERLVAAAGEARAAMRLAHLDAHRETVPLLSAAQIERYAILRGHRSAAPVACDTVPEGHDSEMWRAHHGC